MNVLNIFLKDIKKNIAFIEKVASNNNEEKILNIPIENDKKFTEDPQ